MSSHIKLDQSKLLGFKIQHKQPLKFNMKIGAKIGGAPKPGMKSSTKPS